MHSTTRRRLSPGPQETLVLPALKHEGVRTNKDGSTPIFVGPKPPKGWENNWIKSASGRAWFPYFRFYGPTKPFFDQSWKLPPVEEVDFEQFSQN